MAAPKKIESATAGQSAIKPSPEAASDHDLEEAPVATRCSM